MNQDTTIFQSNAITEGRYDYTACQLNILFTLLASLQKGDSKDKVYSIAVKDIQELTGNEWNYTRFSQSAFDMQKQFIFVKTKTGYKTISPFDYVEYFDAGGRVEIKIGPAARPYFFDLKENFTALQLRSLLLCSSKHAKRIYAMCCQWKKKGHFTISLSTLKERLFLKDPKNKFKEQFAQFGMFKVNVLDVAKTQINTHSDLTIEYKPIKTGHAFTDIEFTIKSKGAIQPEIDFKMPIDTQKYINEIKGYGIREPHLTNIATAMAESDRIKVSVKEIITETMVKFSKQEVKDYAAYIVDALKRKKIIK